MQLKAFEDKARQSHLENNSHSIIKDEIEFNEMKIDGQGQGAVLSWISEPVETTVNCQSKPLNKDKDEEQ